MSFIFGGDTGQSYQDIQRQRDFADQAQRVAMQTPRNVPEGITSVAMALMGRAAQKKSDKQAQALLNKFLGQTEMTPEQQMQLQDAALGKILGLIK